MLTSPLRRRDAGTADAHSPPLDTDAGLRHSIQGTGRSDAWDAPVTSDLLAEIRRRAVRNAAHLASTTGVPLDRALVDDVQVAAWLILRQHGAKVLAAAHPWAYLMSSAQRQVFDEIRAQQLLTNAASIRGRAREVLPRGVRPVGSTPTDLAAAFRHEPRGPNSDTVVDPRIVRQVRRRMPTPLLAGTAEQTAAAPLCDREPWFVAFVDLLVDFGVDESVTVAAVDRLSDLFAITYVGWWEWAARRDPVLLGLGLSPDQCGALVALLAGSRRYRHNGKRDSLLAAARSALERGVEVELSAAQRRRLAVYAGRDTSGAQPPLVRAPELANAGQSMAMIPKPSTTMRGEGR